METIPPDVFDVICSYLEANTLASFLVTSSAGKHDLTIDHSLRLRSDFFPWASYSLAFGCKPYKSLMGELDQRLKMEHASFNKELRIESMTRTRKLAAAILNSTVKLSPLLGAAILLFSVFEALHLNNPSLWPALAVFAPLYFLFFYCTGCIISFFAASKYGLVNDEDAVNNGNVAFGLFFCAALPATLFALYCSGARWNVLFIPAWIGLSVACCVPCLKKASLDPFNSSSSVTTLLWGLPLVLLLAFAQARLSGVVSWSIVVVLIPAWIVAAVLLCIPLCALIAASRRPTLTRSESLRVSFAFAFASFVCVVPWVLFEVLICVYLLGRGKLSAMGVFTPIFIWCAGVFLGLVVFSSARRRIRPRALIV